MDIHYRKILTFLPILMTNSVIKVQAQRSAMDYEGCFDQNHCLGYPEGCVNNKTCILMTHLKMTGDIVDVRITEMQPMFIESNIESDYIAMAFSDDNKMGKDLVFACNLGWAKKDDIKVNMFWNEGKSQPSKLQNERNYTIRSSHIKSLVADGEPPGIDCRFTLEKNVTVKGKQFDFEKGYYILLATGKVKGDQLQKHTDKVASKSKFGNHENQTVTEGYSMPTSSPEAEINTEGRSTLTIKSATTIQKNQPTSKAANDGGDGKEATGSATDGGDGKEATGLAINHFLSIFAISLTFVSYFLNA